MIKCKLIDVTTDNRAAICIGDGAKGKVVQTRRIAWINYEVKQVAAGHQVYDFSGPMLP